MIQGGLGSEIVDKPVISLMVVWGWGGTIVQKGYDIIKTYKKKYAGRKGNLNG